MRPIKFRAWDTQRKCFIGYTDFAGMVNPTDGGNKTIQLRHSDSVILMQFTGLLDSKGCEIYEGDVVKDSVGSMVIEFRNGQFVSVSKIAQENGFDPWKVSTVSDKVEIIGNIYENPELLK